MKLIIKDDRIQVGEWVARHIMDRLNSATPSAESPFVLGLPTGQSSYITYKWLVHFFRKGELSFEHVVVFCLDEYVGLARDHPHSKRSNMWHNFFKHVKCVLPIVV
jgi:glucosamine-6-phosphate deaminase